MLATTWGADGSEQRRSSGRGRREDHRLGPDTGTARRGFEKGHKRPIRLPEILKSQWPGAFTTKALQRVPLSTCPPATREKRPPNRTSISPQGAAGRPLGAAAALV